MYNFTIILTTCFEMIHEKNMKKHLITSILLLASFVTVCAQSNKYPKDLSDRFRHADSTVAATNFSRPVIAVPSGKDAAAISQEIISCGGIPVAVPVAGDDFNFFRDMFASFDAFAFTPEFAANPNPFVLKAFAEQNLPVLGTCALLEEINKGMKHFNSGISDVKGLVGKAATFKKAKQIMDRCLSLDTHGDLACRYGGKDPASIGVRKRNQISIQKMYEGHLASRYIVDYLGQGPIDKEGLDKAVDKAFAILGKIEDDIARNSDFCGLARNRAEAVQLINQGKKPMFISLENAYGIGDDLKNIKKMADRGVTYMTLSHSGDNQVCHTCSGAKDPMAGLTKFGRKVVKELNRCGIIIDLSHPSEGTFWDVCKYSKVPFVFTHSGAKAVYAHDRNVTDEQLKALAEHGGVIQIYIVDSFMGSKEGRLVGLADMVEHIDHCVKVAGIDHVGVGIDFDGGGGGWDYNGDNDAINLTVALLEKGYSEADICKIWGENFFRVMQEVQDYAASLKK